MSDHNICFYREMQKKLLKLSSNIIHICFADENVKTVVLKLVVALTM